MQIRIKTKNNSTAKRERPHSIVNGQTAAFRSNVGNWFFKELRGTIDLLAPEESSLVGPDISKCSK